MLFTLPLMLLEAPLLPPLPSSLLVLLELELELPRVALFARALAWHCRTIFSS